MRMMSIFAAFVAVSASAAPEITNISVSRNDAANMMTLTYDLSEEAIVTVSVTAGGVRLAQEAYGEFGGDVAMVVSAGEGKTVFWKRPGGLVETEVKLAAWTKADPPDYLAVDLRAASHWRFYETAGDVPYGVTNRLYKTDKLLLRKIYAAGIKWPMGVSSDVTYKAPMLKLHYVTLTENYYIGVFELTKRQVGNAVDNEVKLPGAIGTDDLRPYSISYNNMRGTSKLWPADGHSVDSSKPVGKIRARTGLTLDLPTEAQWEYACRAGEAKALYTGEDFTLANLSKIAWVSQNWSEDPDGEELTTHEVGLRLPNKWGLYDMAGNGSDVCLDAMSSSPTATDTDMDPYQGADAIDPVGTTNSNTARHARRGGAVASTAGGNTSAVNFSTTSSVTASSHSRENVSATAGYRHLAYRMTMPAVIP